MSGVPGNNYFTVQGFGNPVPAAYGGERAGPWPSLSNDRRSTEVGNLATVVNSATRINMQFENMNEFVEKKKRLSGAAKRQRARSKMDHTTVSRHTYYSPDEGSSVAKRPRFEVPQQSDFMDSAPPPPPCWFSGNERDVQHRSEQQAKPSNTVTPSQERLFSRESTRWRGGNSGATTPDKTHESRQSRDAGHNIHHPRGNAEFVGSSAQQQRSRWNDTSSSPGKSNSASHNIQNFGGIGSYAGNNKKLQQTRNTAQPQVNLWNDSSGTTSRAGRWMGETEFMTHFDSNQDQGQVRPTRRESLAQASIRNDVSAISRTITDNTRWKVVNEPASNLSNNRSGGQPRSSITSLPGGNVSATYLSSSRDTRLRGGVPVQSSLKPCTQPISRAVPSYQSPGSHTSTSSEKRKFYVVDTAIPTGKIAKQRQPLVEKAWNDALMNLILASRDGSPFQITRCYFDRDIYVVKLASQRGVGALENMVERLPELWKGAKLRFVTQIPEQKVHKVTMMLRGACAKLPTDTVLEMIGKQNVGLNVNKWHVLRRNELEQGCLFVVTLDDDSCNTLIQNKGRAFLLSSTITFRINKKPLGFEASQNANASPNNMLSKNGESKKKKTNVIATKNSTSVGSSFSSGSVVAQTQSQLQRKVIVDPMNSDHQTDASVNKKFQVKPSKDTSKVTRNQYRAAIKICSRLNGKANLPKKSAESLVWAKNIIAKAKVELSTCNIMELKSIERSKETNAYGVKPKTDEAVKLEKPIPSNSTDVTIVEEIVKPKLITDAAIECNPIAPVESSAKNVDCQNSNEEISAKVLETSPSVTISVSTIDSDPISVGNDSQLAPKSLVKNEDEQAVDTNFLPSMTSTSGEKVTEDDAFKADETPVTVVPTPNMAIESTAKPTRETLPNTVSTPTPANQNTEVDAESHSFTESSSIATEITEAPFTTTTLASVTTASISNTECVPNAKPDLTSASSTEILPITVSTPTPDNRSTEVDGETSASTESACNADCTANPTTDKIEVSSDIKDTKENFTESLGGDVNKSDETLTTISTSNTESVSNVKSESISTPSTETLPVPVSTPTAPDIENIKDICAEVLGSAISPSEEK